MKIKVNGLGKKFYKEWIFRQFDALFESSNSYAITGANGTGKSTLIRVLTGFISPTEGTIHYQQEDEIIPTDKIFQKLDIIAPYLELTEEFTLNEFLAFHFKFKTLQEGLSADEFVEKVYLQKDRDKQIRNFSSGMKQRLKLGLGFFSKSEICFLDEPTINLDSRGIDWYQEHIRNIINKKLVLISSNQPYEYECCCTQNIHIADY